VLGEDFSDFRKASFILKVDGPDIPEIRNRFSRVR
jgi:hypothetical protein